MVPIQQDRIRKAKDWGKARHPGVLKWDSASASMCCLATSIVRSLTFALYSKTAAGSDRIRLWVWPARISIRNLRWLREICPPELASMLPSLELQRRAGEANGAVGLRTDRGRFVVLFRPEASTKSDNPSGCRCFDMGRVAGSAGRGQ